MSTPIRLVQRDGKLIQLDAETLDIKVGRGVVGIPIPVVGERFGADMNVVKVGINIKGIIQDDDCAGSSGTSASASIDFGQPHTREPDDPLVYLEGDSSGGGVAIYDILNKPFYLRSTHQQSLGDGSRITFKFISSGTLGAATFTGSHGVNGEIRISLNHANILGDIGPSSGSFTSIAHELATYLKNALSNTADNIGIVITSSSSQRLGHAFGASLAQSRVNAVGLASVEISQIETGVDGDSSTPTFWSTITDSSGLENQLAAVPPSYFPFIGGLDSSCLSAGDKVQNLIANVANSNVMGAVGEIIQLDTNDEEKSLISTDFNKLDPTAGASSDYIVGIQIPYQSLIQSSTDEYVARNFLLVTGLSPAAHQGAAANTESVGVEFDSQNVYTGIRGTVSGFSASYKGGETFYGFNLQFEPIDMIVGL